ncbi:hypothetical protein [Halalkalibacter krulwichiae]|uniref:Uncharacterized protein n=1 Tax=Halalkalibacter krulwichiae TaxID=199441 RepID=A0A1X9MFE6_9BACI|nr:hypothetical protein [Halalkalibacter krulwichiae]ARK32177.1 hypothetical protein BkAM31D_21290 [Halalkalibacter krulwichiae]
MKQSLSFSVKERELVVEAMEIYRNRYEGVGQMRFDLILSKAQQGVSEFDSEEMSYIVQALTAYARFKSLLPDSNKEVDYSELAKFVKDANNDFQIKHMPVKEVSSYVQSSIH